FAPKSARCTRLRGRVPASGGDRLASHARSWGLVGAAESPHGAVEEDIEGGDGDPERVGAGLARPLVDEAEADRGAGAVGQGLEHRVDAGAVAAPILFGDERLVGAGRGRDRLEGEVAEDAARSLAPSVVVDDLVLGDLPEPAVDALALPAEAADLLESGRDGLAEDALGGRAVAEAREDHRAEKRISVS